MNKVAIYIRVSTNEQDERNQIKACKEFCINHGWESLGIYSDHAKSVYKSVKRPEYKELMDMVYKRQLQHIVVWALDRWCRTGGVELLNSMSLLNSYGVQLHSVQESFIEEFNIPGEMGIHLRNFVIGILGWQAKQESEKKGKRVKDSLKFQKALDKKRVGRPTIPKNIRLKVIKLLKEGKSYSFIHNNVTYKAKYGKIKHISTSTIGEIKQSLSEKG